MKKSIEKKYAIIISLFVTVVIFVCWSANALLLSRYYVSRKLNSIESVYAQLDDASRSYGIESSQFIAIFGSGTDTFNCDILILDQDMNIKISNVLDSDATANRLISYFFTLNSDPLTRILDRNDNYTTQIITDFDSGFEFLELWGVMSTGNPIIIRSSISGIQDDAKLANIFLAYVGIIVIIISYLLVVLISKSITQPILEIVEISDKMAKLDFDAKYEGKDENEIGLLGKHINQLSETLEKTISELKTANTDLEKELKKRTEIDDMRKEFISNVSHELKTPIALIQGYAEGLTDCVNDNDESRDFYCEVIIDESRKMNRLVRSLLELNELEFGKKQIYIERFDIAEVIKNCIQATDIVLKQREIKVSFDYKEPVYVWSDEFRIEQVFNNYFSNAIHHVDENNKVIKVNITQNDKKVRVCVFNYGKPIPEEALPKLWTKFYKVDKARTREYGGSGVGLSIVKATLDALNQNYGVVNCEDGVEFYFEVEAD